MIIAWDIETAPLPLTSYSERQERRHEKELGKLMRNRGIGTSREELSSMARSLHPMLGYIACISVVRLDKRTMEPAEPKSYFGHLPGQEQLLLARFWEDIGTLPDRGLLWVTFNGKKFDADWLRVRSAYHGLKPTRKDILDTYPWKHRPHCDLM
ncbi:MAG: exonuclease, partial [Bacteroidota bacterium]